MLQIRKLEKLIADENVEMVLYTIRHPDAMKRILEKSTMVAGKGYVYRNYTMINVGGHDDWVVVFWDGEEYVTEGKYNSMGIVNLLGLSQ